MPREVLCILGCGLSELCGFGGGGGGARGGAAFFFFFFGLGWGGRWRVAVVGVKRVFSETDEKG